MQATVRGYHSNVLEKLYVMPAATHNDAINLDTAHGAYIFTKTTGLS